MTQLPLHFHPTSAVLFAGLGGACEGIRRATGVSPIVAVNHNPHAIALHIANHPGTAHFLEDVYRVKPPRRPLSLLWLSPDCTHHSRAKGGKPRDSGTRSLADAVFPWLQVAKPGLVILENVPDWLSWGPLLPDGKPDPDRKGHLFRAWLTRVQEHGYTVGWRVLTAADYGVPTSRERVYLIASRHGMPRWPDPTHGPGRLPYLTARQCIDWSTPYTGTVSALCDATRARIAAGRHLGERYLVSYYGTGHAHSLDRPLPTVTTVDRFGLVDGERYRMLTPRELATAMGFPPNYHLSGPRREQVARVGNAVCPPVAEALVRANLGLDANTSTC